MRVPVALAFCLLSFPATAADQGRCAIEAAGRLPPAPGLQVKSAQMRQPSARDLSEYAHAVTPPALIDFTVSAFGFETRYSFMCLDLKTGYIVRPAP